MNTLIMAAIIIAISMFLGASLHLIPLSWEKKAKNGTFIPACSMTPAEANKRNSHTTGWPSSRTATIIIDFETKPENRGMAEIDAAPTRQHTVVTGIDL